MFNLDEVDVDFNDIFDDLKSKSSLNINASNDEGALSYGFGTSSDRKEEICLPKKICLENQLLSSQISILSKDNDAKNIKEYQNNYYNSQNFNSLFSKSLSAKQDIDSFSYSPITSTQKAIGFNSKGYLFDNSNKISPIKIKPGICSELKKPEVNKMCSTKTKTTRIDINHSSNIRKFPGPAGNLPKVSVHHFQPVGNNRSETKKLEKTNISNQESTDYNSYSSQIENSDTWKIIKHFLGNDCWLEFQKYKLDKVFQMVTQPNGLPNSKIPIICLVLNEIEYLSMDAAALLSDPTGSIRSAIHRQVLETYSEKLKTGSVFILKKVSIFSISGKKYYLNVTKSNVVDIISPGVDDWENHPLICKKDMEKLIDECSEIPKIIFDPKSVFNDSNVQSPINQLKNLPVESTNIPDQKEIDFFDDDMDEFLVSFMDESFADN